MHTSASSANPLAVMPLPQLIAKFAGPSIVAMLVTTLYNIVDQIFIGWGVGYLGNAATTVAFPLTSMTLALALLNGVGSAANFSLELGKGNKAMARSIVGCGITLSICIGIGYLVLGQCLLTVLLPLFGATADTLPLALTYSRIVLIGMPFLIISNVCSNLIRADGSPSYSMLCMISGAVLNCILDPLFIFGFHWGMAGAALATILGQIVSAILAFRYIPRFKQVHLQRTDFVLNAAITTRTFELGASSSLNQVAILIVQVALNNSLKLYGASSIYGSDIPIAAAGITLKLYGLFNAVIVGLSQGCQPIFGFNYGAKHYPRVKGTLKIAIGVSMVLGLCIELLFQVFPRQCMMLFGNGSELYLDFGSRFLRTYLLSLPILGIQMITSNFLAAISKPWKGVLLSLSRQVLFFLPLILLLPRMMGLNGVLWSAPIADVLAVLLSLWMIRQVTCYSICAHLISSKSEHICFLATFKLKLKQVCFPAN